MKTLVLYGSTMGNTEHAAQQIATALGAEIHNVTTIQATELTDYDFLILGTSTWGAGDLQEDWAAFLPQLDAIDLTGKMVAVFGLGDQSIYTDTFVDGMADLQKKAHARGAALIGSWPVEKYTFESSRAICDNKFIGLALDADSQPELTDARITAWTQQLQKEIDQA